MQSNNFLDLLKKHKESSLYHRYINNDNVLPLLQNLNNNFEVDNVGYSVNNEPIFSITIGAGSKRILMWSQMHGNESTTTKALFDVMNILNQSNWFSEEVLKNCTLKIIPILNPDGARLYTRLNANNIDDATNDDGHDADVVDGHDGLRRRCRHRSSQGAPLTL